MDETTTPAPEATPAAPAESQATQNDQPLTKETRRSSAADKLKAFLAEKSNARKAEQDGFKASDAKAPVDTAVAIEKTAARIERAGGEAVEQKPGESDAKYELRLAKQLRELRLEKERASKFEATANESSAKAAKLEKLLESGKANPLTILEHLGYSFADVVKGINDDKFKAPEKRLELPPEIAERLERLDRAEKEREQQALAQRAQAERAQHETQVVDFVKENVDDYPLVSSMMDFQKVVVGKAYANKTSDITGILESMETQLAAELDPILSSEKAMAALIKRSPKLREALVKGLGLEAPAAPVAESKERKSLDQLATEPGTPGKKMTKEQRQALAVAKLREARKS